MITDENRRVLVSGASSGIGTAVANRFARGGYDVCLNARRRDRLETLVSSWPLGDHMICAGDYSDPDTAGRLGQMIDRHWGGLDVLVNSAGISEQAHVIDSPLEQWRHCLDVMLDGAIHLTRGVAPLMRQGGRIIHITSIHGGRAEHLTSGYAVAKAAINQYCRSLALELADRGILVNAIAPGFVDTPMSSVTGTNELESDWFKQNYVDGHHLPLRRAATPDEIAGVALFLAGPDASYITGQVIVVDGGLTITF